MAITVITRKEFDICDEEGNACAYVVFSKYPNNVTIRTPTGQGPVDQEIALAIARCIDDNIGWENE